MTTTSLSFEEGTIPADLKALPQWVCWRAKRNGERIEKIPVCPATGGNASSTDSQTWTDYASATMATSRRDGLGIGFVFQRGCGIVGIDLDKCRDVDTGVLEPWAEEIVRALNSYTEVSPSGTGVHVYVCGALPPGRRKKGKIEVYEDGRFFTVTGQHLAGTPMTMENRTDELAAFHARYLADPAPERPASTMARTATLGDVEIVDRCRTARNAGKFDPLWRGTVSGYASQSDADLALIGILKFYTQDPGQLDRLFRQSGLMREKWDERRGEHTYGERTIAKALAHVGETCTAHENSMGSMSEMSVSEQAPSEPISLPAVIPLDDVTLPDFPVDAFPASLGNMIAAVAQATETPMELAAMMGLATVATCCQKSFIVQGAEGYTEPLSLWTVAALESGNRKTAVLMRMTAPLVDHERGLRVKGEPDRAAKESARLTVEAQVKALRNRIATSEDIGDIAGFKTKLSEMESTMPAAPTVPQLWAQDVTPEKLAVLMADNGEAMALLSDEGGLFDMMAGRYSNGIPNLDLYLQGHARARVRVDRGSRPQVDLSSPALTIGISPQPSVLRGLTRGAGFRERGLLARFLYALPASTLGYRRLSAPSVPDSVATNYGAMIKALLTIEPAKDDGGRVVPMTLRLSAEAHSEWQKFALSVESHLRPGGEFEYLKDWAGKLPGAALRVAGVFHCIIHAHSIPQEHRISFATLDQALTLLAVIAKHTIAVFDMMGADPALEGARKVMRWVQRERKNTFTARDCYQALRGSYSTMALLDPALKLLGERGQLVPMESTYTGKGRPPSQTYSVHPDLSKGWI